MNVILKQAAVATASAKPATAIDYQLVRGILAGAYGEGGAFGELYSTARRIVDRDVESWTVEWTGTAERVEAIAHDCLSGGHVVSAREAFLRASLYWRTGLFYLESKDPRQLLMYHRHRSCFRQGSALFDPPIEPVRIPYENGKTLPGYFMRASASGGPRPTLMILGGGDTTCEELYDFGGGAAAVRRGYNAFLWEGPGQVGAYALDPSLTYRPDWEVPTRYAVGAQHGRIFRPAGGGVREAHYRRDRQFADAGVQARPHGRIGSRSERALRQRH
jgi:hypothetical protein